MDWLLENLGKLFPIILALIYIISSLKGKGEEDEREQDPEAAARARKIQEEIRRKILERQQQGAPLARPVPSGEEGAQAFPRELGGEPVVFVNERRPERDVPSTPARAGVPYGGGEYVDPFAEKRAQVEAQLKKAKELREKALAVDSGGAGPAQQPASTRPLGSGIGEAVRRGLRSPEELKAAIVLREVLDKPLGLR